MLNEGKTKEFKTIEEQLKILKERGLIIDDEEQALHILLTTNYYRLSAYSLTLRKSNHFYDEITLDNIVELYLFDDNFRSLIMQYTSFIEIAFRTYISYHHSEKYGPLGYILNDNFDNKLLHASFLKELDREISRSDDTFIDHHRKDLNSVYPFWVAIEVTTFGVLSKLFKNLHTDERTYISKKYYKVHREYVENWLQATVLARNISAHGSRFYNRKIRSCPVKLDKKMQGRFDSMSPFAFVFAIYKLLPSNKLRLAFKKELISLFKRYPFAQEKHMGFPENWIKLLEEQTIP
ncbi:Abi family protein [Aminipila luticellarii]|nr:Abi family protein [Aminipila luticellarii]